jgi:hypothetical protein
MRMRLSILVLLVLLRSAAASDETKPPSFRFYKMKTGEGIVALVVPRNTTDRHEETRTPDLYRVNYEVTDLNPFACFAFPQIISKKYVNFDEFW